jgi:hypothetical protein
MIVLITVDLMWTYKNIQALYKAVNTEIHSHTHTHTHTRAHLHTKTSEHLKSFEVRKIHLAGNKLTMTEYRKHVSMIAKWTNFYYFVLYFSFILKIRPIGNSNQEHM